MIYVRTVTAAVKSRNNVFAARNHSSVRMEDTMKFDVIYRTSTSFVVEIKENGYFSSEQEHEIYVNGNLAEKSDRNVATVFGLEPSTTYDVRIKCGAEESEEFKVTTEEEFVTLNVRDFGAKGDGETDDTRFIQCAINACPKGGRVYIPAGVYKIYPLFLKSDLVLDIGKDATLSAFTDRTKFPILPGKIECVDKEKEYLLGTWEGDPLDMFAGIITGINVENVVITGQGTIDGCASRENWWDNPKVKRIAWRPRMIFLNKCKNVVLHGITVTNSPSWNIHPYFSKDLKFIGISVLGPKDSPNTDGLDPESCKNVDIIGVYFSVGDDCIAIKSGKIYMGAKYKTPSENLTIRQCCMRDGHGSITIGSEMAGGVKNLNVENCLFLHTDRGLRIKTRRGRGKDAIVTGIRFENIIMDHVMTPVVMNSFYFCDVDGHSDYVQSKEFHPVDERTPYLGDFLFRNLKATNCHAAASYLYGLPEQKIHHVVFENASFSFAENPTAGVPAMMDGVDKQTNTGIFAKNIETLELRNVTVSGQNGDAVISDGIDQFVQ